MKGPKRRGKAFWTDLNYWLAFKMYIIDKMFKKRPYANSSNFSPHLDWPVLSEASHFLTRSLSVHLLQLKNEGNQLFQQQRDENDNIWQKDTMNVGIHLSQFNLPVIKAVPSKFHLPAKTAPLWASTLFSIRPLLETRWNFPTESREKCWMSRAV